MDDQFREEDNENKPMVDLDDILGVSVYNPPPKRRIPSEDEIKSMRVGMTLFFLGVAIGGNLLNRYLALNEGWFIPELSMFAGTTLVLGLYFLLFPGFFKSDAEGKSNASFIFVILFALIMGFLNMLAVENGYLF